MFLQKGYRNGLLTEMRVQRDDLMNPFWIEDKDLKKAEVDFLTGKEILFWQELIEKYLKPIDADKKKEVNIL
jgi:chitin synthase